MVVRVAAMAMSLLLLAVAVLSIELVGKFECGGGENETPPPQASALRDYCDSDAAYVSLLAPIVVALGWVLTKRTAQWSPVAISWAFATALAVVAALLWHGN